MKGGVKPWRRGSHGRGAQHAVAYALGNECSGVIVDNVVTAGADAALAYAHDSVQRFTVTRENTTVDALDHEALSTWVNGKDPETKEQRGQEAKFDHSILLFDAGINAPKSISIAALMYPELRDELESLFDRVRDEIMVLWLEELRGRRGDGGVRAVHLEQIEVVELRHSESRALDPHIHRHLWLNVKALGEDDKWGNLDAVTRLQVLVNSRGDLLMKSDKQWRDALARYGLTLDAETGEINEIPNHVRRQFSKRSNQIAEHKTELERQWRLGNPGLEPSPQWRDAWDRLAWGMDRAGKTDISASELRAKVVDELASIWPDGLSRDAGAVPAPNISSVTVTQGGANQTTTGAPSGATPATSGEATDALLESTPATGDPVGVVGGADNVEIDVDELALRSVIWADKRSSRSNSRFNLWELSAGAEHVVSTLGLVNDVEMLKGLARQVEEVALNRFVKSLVDKDDMPRQVKNFQYSATSRMRERVNTGFSVYASRQVTVEEPTILDMAQGDVPLDADQEASAKAICSAQSLVTVVGAAGAGKTTMLKVAHKNLDANGRRMVVFAPTRQAALVAGEEIGVDAGAVHELLYDYGWRWSQSRHGQEVWNRIPNGGVDQDTGEIIEYGAKFRLSRTDRVVVDEAGMLDLNATYALQKVLNETGASLALVGDPYQVRPVGHAGAMNMAINNANIAVTMTNVHRFRNSDGSKDIEYSDIAGQMREAKNRAEALKVAKFLEQRGLLHTTGTFQDFSREAIRHYFKAHSEKRTIAITTATNEEAQALNEKIQAERIKRGQVHVSKHRHALGQDQQIIGVGDIIQTRKNDRELGVSNREVWTVERIRKNGDVVLRARADIEKVTTVPASYFSAYAHLAYANTAHGIQGATTDFAITAPGVTDAGAYVGMTRGKRANHLFVSPRQGESVLDAAVAIIQTGSIEATEEESLNAVVEEYLKATKDTAPAQTPVRKRTVQFADEDRFGVAGQAMTGRDAGIGLS